MLSIKKSSLFFAKSLLLKYIFYFKNTLAFYDYLYFNSADYSFFFKLLLLFNLNFFFLSSSFINFFFKFKFFFFFKPGVFLIYTNSFDEFLNFDSKIKDLVSIYLIGYFFNYFFFNFLKIPNLKAISLNFTLLDFIIFIYIFILQFINVLLGAPYFILFYLFFLCS